MTISRTSIRWAKDEKGVVTLTLNDPDQAVNTMNAFYRESMARAIERLVHEKDTITGVIVTSAKKSFFAGADLKALLKTGPDDAQRIFNEVREMSLRLRALETLGVPVVAALNGTALGEGWSLPLPVIAASLSTMPPPSSGAPK